jgi:hypothetical protein
MIDKLYCAPGNGDISGIAECIPIKVLDIDGIVSFAKSEKIDLVIVAPDDPLAAGMVDALEDAGIRALGPRKNAAIIESSKAFSKDLMKKYGIPTAEYEIFDDYEAAVEKASAYIKEGKVFLLENDEKLIVTMAVTEYRLIHGMVITYVFTPEEYRGIGYAAANIYYLSNLKTQWLKLRAMPFSLLKNADILEYFL